MTLRDKLANWISGNKLSYLKKMEQVNGNRATRWKIECNKMEDALLEIANAETTGANATVKRMAKIAREALK